MRDEEGGGLMGQELFPRQDMEVWLVCASGTTLRPGAVTYCLSCLLEPKFALTMAVGRL